MSRQVPRKKLQEIIVQCLREGADIEIDGIGSFELDADDKVTFRLNDRVRVFLAYADEDVADMRKLYKALQQAGFEPWMDEEKLLPGQNWPRAIKRAIELSDFFVGCFSRRSRVKRGYFQCELAYALDVAKRVPAGDIFVIPVRLNECALDQILDDVHYVDLFPDWERGVEALVRSIRMHSIDQKDKGGAQ